MRGRGGTPEMSSSIVKSGYTDTACPGRLGRRGPGGIPRTCCSARRGECAAPAPPESTSSPMRRFKCNDAVNNPLTSVPPLSTSFLLPQLPACSSSRPVRRRARDFVLRVVVLGEAGAARPFGLCAPSATWRAQRLVTGLLARGLPPPRRRSLHVTPGVNAQARSTDRSPSSAPH